MFLEELILRILLIFCIKLHKFKIDLTDFCGGNILNFLGQKGLEMDWKWGFSDIVRGQYMRLF